MSSVLRSARNVSLCTIASRILGLVRDVVCAFFFITSDLDAFYMALMVPNLLRHIFGEGAVASSFIPVFAEIRNAEGIRGAAKLTRVTFTVLLAVLLVCLLLLFGISFAAGSWISGQWGHTFLELLNIMLPFLVFVCLAALLGAALNSMGTFGLPALGPAILNVFWIGAVILMAGSFGIKAAAIGVLVGGLIEFAVLIPSLSRHGIKLGLDWDLRHPGFRKVAGHTGTVIFGFLLVQINTFVDQIIARTMVEGDGAVSALYFGNRLIQFPIGVFGIAMATAVFPTLSARAAENDTKGLKASLRRALRIVFFISVPAAVSLAVLREDTVGLLFQHGRFSEIMTVRTGAVVAFYSTGLWAYCGVHVATRTLYALHDMRSPVRVAGVMVFLNLILNLILVRSMAEAGLALATAISSGLTFVVLMVLITRRIGLLGMRDVVFSFIRTLVSAMAAGSVMACVARQVKMLLGTASISTYGRAAAVGSGVGAGVVVFLMVSLLLKSREAKEIFGVFGTGRGDEQ